MKRFLFIFLIFISVSQGNSQTITNVNIQGIDCYNNTGYISITTDINPGYIIWYEFNDLGDSSQMNQFDDTDSIFVNECGKYRVLIIGPSGTITNTKLYFIPCQLGVNPNNHNNIQCFGDSTGTVGRVAFGGYTPYTYEWFKDGLPFFTSNDTLVQI